MAEPIREPGWYRLTDHGWTPVDADTAAAEIMAGDGRDLVYADTAAMVEDPLF